MDRNDLTQRRGFLEQRLSTLLQEKEPLDEYQQEEVVQTMVTLQSYHDVWWTVRSLSAIAARYGEGDGVWTEIVLNFILGIEYDVLCRCCLSSLLSLHNRKYRMSAICAKMICRSGMDCGNLFSLRWHWLSVKGHLDSVCSSVVSPSCCEDEREKKA